MQAKLQASAKGPILFYPASKTIPKPSLLSLPLTTPSKDAKAATKLHTPNSLFSLKEPPKISCSSSTDTSFPSKSIEKKTENGRNRSIYLLSPVKKPADVEGRRSGSSIEKHTISRFSIFGNNEKMNNLFGKQIKSKSQKSPQMMRSSLFSAEEFCFALEKFANFDSEKNTQSKSKSILKKNGVKTSERKKSVVFSHIIFEFEVECWKKFNKRVFDEGQKTQN